MAKYEDFNDDSFLENADAATEWWASLDQEWQTILAKQANCEIEKPNFQLIKAITKLKCPNTKIENFNAIINLSNITAIVCYGCPNLTNAANLTFLTSLICNDCAALISVTKLASLTWLNCSGCPNLVNLSKLASLTYLNFSNCPNLQKFYFLQNLFDLQIMNFSNNNHLISQDLNFVYKQSTALKELHCKGAKSISLTLKNKFRDKGVKVFD